jgi:hypothetical protein
MVAAISSSSKDDISLGASQEEAPAPSTDAASSSTISQRRGSVPLHRNQFTYKYKAQWKDDFQCKFFKVLVFFIIT